MERAKGKSKQSNAAIEKADRKARRLDVDGNRLTVLPEGEERLEALLDLIRNAKSSLRLLYYIYLPDRSGGLVREALLAAMDRLAEDA